MVPGPGQRSDREVRPLLYAPLRVLSRHSRARTSVRPTNRGVCGGAQWLRRASEPGAASRCSEQPRAARDIAGDADDRGQAVVGLPTRQEGALLLRRRHAAGQGRRLRGRRAPAEMQAPHERRRQGRQRHAAGLPAEHRRRLVHDDDRHLAERARLDQQHLPPHRRGQLQQPHAFSMLQGRPDHAGRHARRVRRARRQEGRPDRLGRRRAVRDRRPDRRLHQLLLDPRRPRRTVPNADRAGGRRHVRPQLPGRRLRRAAGWTNVPAGDPAAAAAADAS